MKNRDIYRRRYRIQETLYIEQWCLWLLRSCHLATSHNSSNCHQLPRRIFLNFFDSLKSLPFQRWFSFWEKPEVIRCQIWAVVGLNHLGDLLFHQKTLQETWCMSGHVVMIKLPVTKLPIAAAFWIIRIISEKECSSLMPNLVQFHCSICSFCFCFNFLKFNLYCIFFHLVP